MEQSSKSGGVAVVLSVIAIVISVYAAEQARRAAAANERLAIIAEEQTRPRITFTDPRATLFPSAFEVAVTTKNLGTAPASISEVRLQTLDSDMRGTYLIADAVGAILYPGDVRVITLVKPRVIRRGASDVDYGALKPGSFIFAVSYQFLGKSTLNFQETVSFTGLEWTLAPVSGARSRRK